MKYALIEGDKIEATKGAKGLCPCCDLELIAKCGEVKINHWSHKGNHHCDPWWENETDWHRSWKDNFHKEWQEVVQYDKSGEKHIADVKTANNWVIEFQHSYIKPEERRSRNTFYPKLIWIVDGTRRRTDKIQFDKVLNDSTAIMNNPLIFKVPFPEECRLLKEWQDSNALVIFDFQEKKESNQSVLWFLFPQVSTTEAYMSQISRQIFIEMHKGSKFDEVVKKNISPFITKLNNDEKIKVEIEEFRRRQELSRMNSFIYGNRRMRF